MNKVREYEATIVLSNQLTFLVYGFGRTQSDALFDVAAEVKLRLGITLTELQPHKVTIQERHFTETLEHLDPLIFEGIDQLEQKG